MNKVTRVLCVRSGFLGDIVISTASLRGIVKKHPDAKITYSCWPQCVEIVSLDPHVAEIVTSGNYMTSDYLPHLVDFRHEALMDAYPLTYWGQLHAMQCAEKGLLDLDGMSFKPELYIGPDDVCEKISEKPLAVLNVFSQNGLNWRLWEPFEKWSELVTILQKMGYKTAQIGGKDDPLVNGIDTQLCGKTRLAQIPGILAIADLFIGIDSFAHHVTCGQKFVRNVEDDTIEKIGDSTPAVLICGPIPWQCVTPTDAKTVPVFDYSFCPGICNHSFASKELPICTHKNSCMKELSVEMVIQKIEEVECCVDLS